MTVYNFCPHNFDMYKEGQFVNLKQLNATTLIADGVIGDALLVIPTSGSIRIATKTEQSTKVIFHGDVVIPAVTTKYGEIEGLPENFVAKENDVLIVSLPTQGLAKSSNHPLSKLMASPYKVVRLATDTSKVLGCMGLSFQ